MQFCYFWPFFHMCTLRIFFLTLSIWINIECLHLLTFYYKIPTFLEHLLKFFMFKMKTKNSFRSNEDTGGHYNVKYNAVFNTALDSFLSQLLSYGTEFHIPSHFIWLGLIERTCLTYPSLFPALDKIVTKETKKNR